MVHSHHHEFILPCVHAYIYTYISNRRKHKIIMPILRELKEIKNNVETLHDRMVKFMSSKTQKRYNRKSRFCAHNVDFSVYDIKPRVDEVRAKLDEAGKSIESFTEVLVIIFKYLTKRRFDDAMDELINLSGDILKTQEDLQTICFPVSEVCFGANLKEMFKQLSLFISWFAYEVIQITERLDACINGIIEFR